MSGIKNFRYLFLLTILMLGAAFSVGCGGGSGGGESKSDLIGVWKIVTTHAVSDSGQSETITFPIESGGSKLNAYYEFTETTFGGSMEFVELNPESNLISDTGVTIKVGDFITCSNMARTITIDDENKTITYEDGNIDSFEISGDTLKITYETNGSFDALERVDSSISENVLEACSAISSGQIY